MSNLFRPPIIDVESSGLNARSYPIEVGIAMGSGNRFAALIRPAPEWTYWNPKAEEFHHLTRNILEKHGQPVREVADRLNKLLDGQTVYSDGWVVDQPWISRLYYAAGIRQRFTISSLELILSEPQMEIWHKTKDAVIKELNLTRHRASTDAFIIQETFVRTRALV
jgi:hypothetical protein